MSASPVRPLQSGASSGTLLDALDGAEKQPQVLTEALVDIEHDTAQLPAQLLALTRQVTSNASAPDAVTDALAQWVHLDAQRTGSDAHASSHSQAREAALLDVIWMLDQELDIYAQLADAQSKSAIESERVRLNDFASQLIIKSAISRTLAGARLEAKQLAELGLVAVPSSYARRRVQINTGRLYKQEKFNLLREESEGFSKVIEVLLAGMGAPMQATLSEKGTAVPTMAEPQDQVERRASRVWKHILALIGYFDLEPTRVLDLILDHFACNVAPHFHFFFSLLAQTPWGQDLVPSTSAIDPRVFPETSWLDCETGNPTIAQVVGFKLRWFAQGPIKGDAPHDLYLMIALLIRHGFLSTRSIWSALYSSEAMAEELKGYQQKLDDAMAEAGANPLALAGALVDDDAPAEAAESKRPKVEPPRPKQAQLVGFTKACLALGMLQHGCLVLARWPWLLGSYPELGSLYCRLLRPILRPAYHALVPGAASEPEPASAEGNVPIFVPPQWDKKGEHLLPSKPPLCYLVSTIPPADTTKVRFAFFYAEWHSSLSRVSTAEEVLSDFVPLLNLLGPYLHYDLQLLQQVARITAAGLRLQPPPPEPDDDDWMAEVVTPSPWLGILRSFLLPACSLSASSATLLAELWASLSQLSYEQRFTIYGEWRYSIYRRKELKAAQAKTEKEAKGILKRVSSDKVAQRIMGRKLAKAAHANPTVFFSVALSQVQVYENMIDPIVEAARYLTEIENDIFTWSLLDALSNPAKQRMKTDGTNLAHWLKSLAAFAGTLYRRYPDMEPAPLLQYIANQLHKNNPNDLVVIRELVLKMSGIEPLVNPADKQVAASAGGRLLRREAFIANDGAQGTPARSDYNRQGERLLASAQASGMLVPLLILIAQCRDACIHMTVPASASDEAPDAHIKFLAALFDSCNETLFQYAEFLTTFLDPQQYAAQVPGLDALLHRFQLRADVAFHIARPAINFSLDSCRKEYRARIEAVKEERERILAEHAGKEAEERAEKEKDRGSPEGSDETSKPAAEVKDERSPEQQEGEIGEGGKSPASTAEAASTTAHGDGGVKTEQATPSRDIEASEGQLTLPEPESPSWWVEPLRDWIAVAERTLSPTFTSLISAQFYVTFWQLSLVDFDVPQDRYRQEISSLNKNGPDTAKRWPLAKALQNELQSVKLNREDTSIRIRAERGAWFKPAREAVEAVIASDTKPAVISGTSKDPVQEVYDNVAWALHQDCFGPRCVLSPIDAAFSARFLRLLHVMGTEGVSTLGLYARVFDTVRLYLFVSTESEARNYARFLEAVLKDLDLWRKDAKVYEKEVIPPTRPGFTTSWVGPNAGTKLSHADYLRQCHAWHSNLFEAFASCIESREYIRFKNTIMTLTRIASFFPVLEEHGNELITLVEAASQEETRGDLKVLLQGLLAVLTKHKKTWVSNMKGEKLAPPKPATTKAASTKPDGARPAAQGKDAVLKGTKPTSASQSPAPTGGQGQSGVVAPSGPRRGVAALPSKPEANTRGSDSARSQPQSSAPLRSGKTVPEEASGRHAYDRRDSGRDRDPRGGRLDPAEAARELALASMRGGRKPDRDSSRDVPRGPASEASSGGTSDRARSPRKRSPPPGSPLPAKRQEREPRAERDRDVGIRIDRRNVAGDEDKSRSARDRDSKVSRDDPAPRGGRDATPSSFRADRERDETQVLDQREAYREALLARRSRERVRGRDESRDTLPGPDARDTDSVKGDEPSAAPRLERRAGRSNAPTHESNSRASSPGRSHRDRDRDRDRDRTNSVGRGSMRGVIEAALDMPPHSDAPSFSRKRGRDREEPAVEERREDDSYKKIRLDSPRDAVASVKIRGRGSGVPDTAISRDHGRDDDRGDRGERGPDTRPSGRDRDREREIKERERERELRRRGAYKRDARDERPSDRPSLDRSQKSTHGSQLANTSAAAAHPKDSSREGTESDARLGHNRAPEGPARWPGRENRNAPPTGNAGRDDRPERVPDWRRHKEDREPAREPMGQNRDRQEPRDFPPRNAPLTGRSRDAPQPDTGSNYQHGRDRAKGGNRKRRDRGRRSGDM